ncbi:MAG: hypothetical protein HFJ27_04070 [Clostridia bacterium]|nr:hypothetical protein [Clostridia bacterium]
MFKKALKSIAPYVVGSIVALAIVALVLGIQRAINTSIPVFVGNCCALIVALYLETKEDNDKGK